MDESNLTKEVYFSVENWLALLGLKTNRVNCYTDLDGRCEKITKAGKMPLVYCPDDRFGRIYQYTGDVFFAAFRDYISGIEEMCKHHGDAFYQMVEEAREEEAREDEN